MNIRELCGSIVALVTPFSEDKHIDFDALARLIEFHIEQHTDALLVLGTTGESSTMSHEEDESVVQFCVERAAGRIPIIAGSGSNCTQTMLQKSLAYQKLGADGLLIIPPYYNKSNEEGIYTHLMTTAEAVEIPCLLYNIPGRCGCSISLSNLERLAAHPNIMGIKEASGSMDYAVQAATYLSDSFRMYSGEDALTVPLMSVGASGTISVWANIQPSVVHELCASFLTGDIMRARTLQLQGLPLIRALFAEVNPIPVKEALALMGFIQPVYREPLTALSTPARAQLITALKEARLYA